MEEEETKERFFRNSVKIARSKFGVSYSVLCSGDNEKEVVTRLHQLVWDIENEADEVKSQGKGKSFGKGKE